MRLPGSVSRTTALNSPSPVAAYRTDPTKSDLSAVAFELDGVHRIFTILPVVPVVDVP